MYTQYIHHYWDAGSFFAISRFTFPLCIIYDFSSVHSFREALECRNQCCGSGSESGSGSTGSTCFWASRIRILLSSCKNRKKNLDSYDFLTPFDFLSLKNDVNVATKSNEQKKLCKKISFLLASWRSMTKIAGSGSRIRIRFRIRIRIQIQIQIQIH